MDGDQTEASWSKRIAENRIDICDELTTSPAQFAQHEVAWLAITNIPDGKLAALSLFRRSEPVAATVLSQNSKKEFGLARKNS